MSEHQWKDLIFQGDHENTDKICKIFIPTSKLYRKLLNDPENAKVHIDEFQAKSLMSFIALNRIRIANIYLVCENRGFSPFLLSS